MSVTVEDLQKSLGGDAHCIKRYVREELQTIDHQLVEHNRCSSGDNIVTISLPTDFPFGGVNKKDAQRIVYFQIVRSLQQRGFVVQLLLEEQSTKISIEWSTGLTKKVSDSMNLVLHNCIVSSPNDGHHRALKSDLTL